MTFYEKLNEYIALLRCTQKELAGASGLSTSVISRYCTGVRTPNANTETLERLTGGIVRLAEEKGLKELTRVSVSRAFSEILAESRFPYERLRQNLNALLSALPVNVSDLSHYLSYNSSYISRIRNGQRRPANPAAFAWKVARFVARRHLAYNDRVILSNLIGCGAEELKEDSDCMSRLAEWLSAGETIREDTVLPFLTRVNEFDLNEFIRSIPFDETMVLAAPFCLPDSKNYYGLAQMRQGSLDFFKAAVLSDSNEPLILSDDTPIADITEGTDFRRQFTFAVAMALKKGLHINMIHNVNRPFEEMMMGLEGWVPLYMTGQISPYYFKDVHNKIFGHLLYSSDTAALAGECVMGYHDRGKYYLTSKKTEVAYYRARAKDLLSKSFPLMSIFRRETGDQFQTFLQTDEDTPGTRRSILTAPPLYTLSEQMLTQILEGKGLSKEVREQVLAHAARQRERMERILERDTVTDEIPVLPEAVFAQQPVTLPLSEMFCERDIPYTYGEYREHLEQTKAYGEEHPNYTAVLGGAHTFRNIQIAIHEGKWVVISRNKAPAIHFVVLHPKLLSAIESFIPPVV